ncbi:MAG TPA: hypothetical protein PL105_08510 [Caldilineaceae bacterium]|nr:hypothetical protein [Caldilineaceae bacterium]
MNYTIGRASKKQIGIILELMLNGISSDPSSVGSLGKSWWQRLAFRYLVGPRMLRNQMETFVAVKDDEVVGYLVLQFEGDTAGTFDWAVTEPADEEGIDILGDLIEAALDHTEKRGDIPLAYFGMQNSEDARIGALLTEMGFWLADYQSGQMRTTLPLAESAQLPAGIAIKPQIALRFGGRLAEFVRMDYDLPNGDEEGEEPVAEPIEEDPEGREAQGLSLAEQVEVICTLHESTLRASKIYLVEEDGEPVGIIQQFNWKEELRLLLALEPFLWGTETEQQLVAAMPEYVGKREGYLRVRTFSSEHLATSRESFEALGLRWEAAPWQRWIVGL